MTSARKPHGTKSVRNTLALPILVIYVLVSAGIVLGTAYWVNEQAEAAVRERSASTLNLVIENLRGELSKFIYMPKLLSSLDSISSVLAAPTDKNSVDTLTEELGNIANVSGAKAIFLLDSTGQKITSSDATPGEPFTPHDSSAQPYFLQAMQGRLGRQFGIDPLSSARSYFFAHPIRQQTSIAGVVMIEVEMDNLEPPWFSADREILVVDEHGIVFLTSRPEWRFRAISALNDATNERVIRKRRYATHYFNPLRLTEGPAKGFMHLEPVIAPAASITNTTSGTTFIVEERQMPDAGWRVLILTNAHGVHRQVLIAVATAISVLLILLLVAGNIYQRRRRMIERMAIQETARQELETRVLERTQNLTETNTKLRDEIDERHRAEAKLKTTQAELVQASKMSALGQMSAGLSHELNQPLAAIRSYAENAEEFLERQRPETARSNLKSIAELTERMARIIKNLRTYSREEEVPARPVLLQNAVQEARSLLEGRLVKSGITVQLDIPNNLPQVMAGDVRLQQVFVNLFSNAIDAMDTATEKTLFVRAVADSGGVQISVHDTGPGVPEDVLENVFDPFYSTKDVGEGMGLGLSVTHGIIRTFGGVITVSNGAEGGAVFTITLPLAENA
jgi:two-component system C4-dicarboxylate transport sensor histidine kinase DctB